MSTDPVSVTSEDWSMLSLAEQDPFPTYEELRKRGEIIWDPGMNCWLVLSYDLCKVIETDEAAYRIQYEKDVPPSWLEIRGGPPAVSVVVGEKHAHMRRLYFKLLGAAAMPSYRDEHVMPVINFLIDRFAGRGSAELVGEFGDEVPNRVMASLFGLPWRDDALMAQTASWHKEMIAWMYDKTNDQLMEKARRASDGLNDLFRPLVRERRDKRGNDMISQIWTASEEYGELSVDDILALVRDIELGAGETTTNAIINALYLFLANGAVRELVTKDQQGQLNALVEETLRLLGALQWRFRVAVSDVLLAGVTIKKGDTICLLHAAANRDPEHYSCPNKIDLGRKPLTDHLTFNVGPRICPGMHLARLTMRECVKAVVARLPNVRLNTAKERPRFRGFSHRSFGPLHVLF